MACRLAARFVVAAFSVVGLSMCAGMASDPWYKTPAGITAANGAKVSLSENETSSADDPDGDTRVVSVDGQRVGAMSWDDVVLPPGAHTLGVKYNGAVSEGNVEIDAILRAGVQYTVRGERQGPCDAVLWLQEQPSGPVIGAKQVTHVFAKPLATGAPVAAVACN